MNVGDRVIVTGCDGAAFPDGVGQSAVIERHDPKDAHCEFYIRFADGSVDWVSRCDITLEADILNGKHDLEQRILVLEAKVAKLQPLLTLLK